MTTIAWDGKTLAADRQGTYNNTPIETPKVFKSSFRGEPCYIGCSGEIEQWSQMLDWINAAMPDEKPEIEDKSFALLIVTKSKKCFYADDSFHFHNMGKAKWAVGSGAQFAMGAMAFGASAMQAVEVACTLDTMTGLGVDSFSPGRL